MANSSFADVSLGDIADFRNGKAISPEKYTAGGKHPVFGSNGQIARSNEVLYPDPAIVIGRVGAYCGCVHYVSRASWVTDNAIVALPKDGNDIRYLFYLLGSLELQRTAIGSAQPLMTQGGLKVVRTKAPPLAEQKAIAAVLGALDDKIELNRRMNATLEAMARALFQSWFIDFDPVRANLDRNQPSPQPSPTGRGSKDREKAELPSPLGRRAGDEGAFGFLDGRQPVGVDPATAALFPDSFQDSEAGHIPKGWAIQPVGEVVDCVGGGTPSTAFAEISKQNFRPIPVVLPPKELMVAFTAKVAPLYAQIIANLHQSRTLATLLTKPRDLEGGEAL